VVAVAQSNLLRVGDRVALAPLNACGRCPDCLRGDVIFCKFRPPVHGNFAQFTRVADINCTRVPDDVSYEHASLMGCAMGPAYEAIKRLGIGPADTLVVSGLGPVGLGAVALASWRGARVVALDPELFRADLATKLGAEAVIDPTDGNCRAMLMEATEQKGVTRAIDCSGKPSSERLLIDMAAVRGMIAFVGENPDTIPISPSQDMIRKGLTLLGCWHMNVLDAPDLVTFLRRFPRKADLLISHKFGFGHVQEAFDVFASRKTAKVLLLPWS
jgi:L-iditol 2-dehydrogenase